MSHATMNGRDEITSHKKWNGRQMEWETNGMEDETRRDRCSVRSTKVNYVWDSGMKGQAHRSIRLQSEGNRTEEMIRLVFIVRTEKSV